jgi:hypothetical protein
MDSKAAASSQAGWCSAIQPKVEIAAAYKLFFDGNPTACEEALKDSYDELTARLARRAKVAYLLGTLVAALACVAVCVPLYLHYSPYRAIVLMIAASGAGGVGGFVSVARDREG